MTFTAHNLIVDLYYQHATLSPKEETAAKGMQFTMNHLSFMISEVTLSP